MSPSQTATQELEANTFPGVESLDTAEQEPTGEEIVNQSLSDISEIQQRVASSLGLDFESPYVVEATDAALVHIAEETALAGSEKSHLDDVVADVVVEGRLEESGSKQSFGENPVAVLKRDGLGDEVREIEERLQGLYAPPPSTHDAHQQIVAEVHNLNQQHNMADRADLNYVEKQSEALSTGERFQELAETLKPRVEQAVEGCEFEASPEVREALRTYYEDHYKTVAIVEQILKQEPVDIGVFDDPDKKLTALQMNNNLRVLVADVQKGVDRQDVINRVNEVLKDSLFGEAAVGVTTLSETEVDMAINLNNLLLETLANEGLYLTHQRNDEQIRDGIKSTEELFWEDSRRAGQLLFHNTPFIDEVAGSDFKLRTRSRQDSETGGHRAVTADREDHSQSIHFSEAFMTDSYKNILAGTRPDQVTIGGTVAVPIAEVIRTLPYGRMGEYGTVSVKEARVLSKVPTIEKTYHSHHNAGADDEQGEAGEDRVFFPDAEDRVKAVDYEIDFGHGMATANGNVSHIILLQHDLDQAHREQYLRNGRDIDTRTTFGSGYGYPQTDVLTYDSARGYLAKDRMIVREGEPFVPTQTVGYSENALGISDDRLSRVATAEGSYRENVSHEDQIAELEQSIKKLQDTSINLPQYKDKVIAMLRSGVMAFKPID